MARVLCTERAFVIALYGGDCAGVRAFHGGKLGVRQAHFVPWRTAEQKTLAFLFLFFDISIFLQEIRSLDDIHSVNYI